jgi:tetratricopeptide (TPR) repeat protein
MGRFICVVATIGLLAAVAVRAETNATPSEAELALQRAVTALQEQQQATLRAIEQSRQEAETAAKKNAEAMAARFKEIEDGANQQREREVETLQTAHRFTLTVMGVVAGVGFLSLLVVALFLLRSLSRRPALAPVNLTEDAGALALLDPAQQSSARLRASLSRLEDRLDELEGSTEETETKALEQPEENGDPGGRISLLLGKGQALLNLQQSEAALGCFEEVIAADAANAEAFVKKGTALERLGRLDEAISCYDQAIALDTSMTMAYLCKGGVFNRLERYGEALQCYEQALHAQQKTGVA